MNLIGEEAKSYNVLLEGIKVRSSKVAEANNLPQNSLFFLLDLDCCKAWSVGFSVNGPQVYAATRSVFEAKICNTFTNSLGLITWFINYSHDHRAFLACPVEPDISCLFRQLFAVA